MWYILQREQILCEHKNWADQLHELKEQNRAKL